MRKSTWIILIIDFGLKRFYDDRAVHVEFNTGKILG